METDIRNLKETMALDRISGKSVDMVDKELAAGVVAYNLANQVRAWRRRVGRSRRGD